MSFIDSYLDYTKEYESPTSFWLYSGYAVVSAILRDNVWRRQGNSNLYPNLYTLTIAQSGGRKGAPCNLAESLIRAVGNTRVISGRASVQAVLDELARTETDRKTGKVTKGGSAILIAPELAAGLVEDPAGVKILTDIYDMRPSGFESFLRTRGTFKIDKLVFSILAATNLEMSHEIINTIAIKGGFIARSMVVCPSERRPANPMMDDIDTSKGFEMLAQELRRIAELRGEFSIGETAKNIYKVWYLKYYEQFTKKADPTGIFGRMHTSIVKLAMVHAAVDLSMEIRPCHIETAIDQGVKLFPNYSMLAMSGGKSNTTEAGQVMLQELLKAPGYRMTASELLRDNWSTIGDLDMLDKIANMFIVAQHIERVTEGSVITYSLTQRFLDKMGRGKDTIH